MKTRIKKIGKVVWSALPWIMMTIGLTCWLMLPVLYANEKADLKSQISALEAENTHLEEDLEWLRSLVDESSREGGDGQVQQ